MPELFCDQAGTCSISSWQVKRDMEACLRSRTALDMQSRASCSPGRSCQLCDTPAELTRGSRGRISCRQADLGRVDSGACSGVGSSIVLLLWAFSLRHTGACTFGIKPPAMVTALEGAVCFNPAF